MPNSNFSESVSSCSVCGKNVDFCICLECPICGEVGNPNCYNTHGLILSPEQIVSLETENLHWEKEAEKASYAEALWNQKQERENP